MKFFRYLLLAAATLVSFSCQEVDKTEAMPASDVKAPVMDEHSDILVDKDNLVSDVTFSWSSVDYGYPAAVSYSLFCVYGEKEPYQIGESFSTSFSITKESLNNILVNSKGLAVPEDATSTVYFYVQSSISSTTPAYTFKSEPISLKVTTIKSTSAPWVRRCIYVAGAFQGWDPAKAPVLWETAENSDVYEGLVDMTHNFDSSVTDGKAHFKFCVIAGWAGNLGGDPSALSSEGDPAHIILDHDTYWLTVTLSADHKTGSMKAKKVYLGVVGAAVGGWTDTSDIHMKSDAAGATDDDLKAAVNAQVWSATIDNCAGGEFKYRFDHAWDYSWGGDDLKHLVFKSATNCSTTLTGKVKFTINFRGDIEALSQDTTNPSPISATVTQVN